MGTCYQLIRPDIKEIFELGKNFWFLESYFNIYKNQELITYIDGTKEIHNLFIIDSEEYLFEVLKDDNFFDFNFSYFKLISKLIYAWCEQKPVYITNDSHGCTALYENQYTYKKYPIEHLHKTTASRYFNEKMDMNLNYGEKIAERIKNILILYKNVDL